MKFTFLALFLLTSLVSIAQTVRPYAPELFPEHLSGAVCGFSPDGKTIYFVREQPRSQLLWMFEAKWNGAKWANEIILPFSGVYSDMGGRLSADGTKLYFTSNRPGGSKDPDDTWNIWEVDKTTNGWSNPQPLAAINDRGLECCPLPLSDGTLMFSGTRGKAEWQMLLLVNGEEISIGNASIANAWQWPSYQDTARGILLFNSMKRPDTKGMDDIYMSRFENGSWSEAINLGEKVNTKVYEDGAIVSPDKTLLIFCRHDTHETPSKVLCVEWSEVH